MGQAFKSPPLEATAQTEHAKLTRLSIAVHRAVVSQYPHSWEYLRSPPAAQMHRNYHFQEDHLVLSGMISLCCESQLQHLLSLSSDDLFYVTLFYHV